MDLKTGDILMFDSNKTGPRIVKFFMTAPTFWHYLWRAIRGTQEKVKYYHVAMVYDSGIGETGLKGEQQWKVKFSDLYPIPESGVFIARYRRMTEDAKTQIMAEIRKDLGKNWDLLNVLGKTMTYFTGIRFFAQYVQWPGQEICVDRVAEWIWRVFRYLFGTHNFEETTTHVMYKWIKSHPQDWEIIKES